MSITIDPIATDNIINDAEAGTTITGTNTAGAMVTLTIGGATGQSRTATVVGATWSYALTPIDIAYMGQSNMGQYVAIIATATGAGDASTTRNIQVDTIAPSATATAEITMVNDNKGLNKGILMSPESMSPPQTSGDFTDDTTPTLSGTISATLTGLDVVAVYDGLLKLGNATVTVSPGRRRSTWL